MKLLVIAPCLWALGFVLTVYVDSGSALEALPRPLVVALLVALTVQAVATALLRNRARGSVAALVVLAGLASPLVAIVIVMMTVAIIVFTRWRPASRASMASAGGAIVALVFTVAAGRVVFSASFDLAGLVRPPSAMAVGVSSDSRHPDIFLLMLDAYPRSDTLAGWGYDNTWFVEALEGRGFEVAEASHSVYSATQSVLPAMFQMRRLDDIEVFQSAGEGRNAFRQAVRTALAGSPVLKHLGDSGYATISAGHPANFMTLPTDRYLDQGRLTEFEHQILNRTMLAPSTLPAVYEARRGRVVDTLMAATAVATDPDATFLFAHVMSPHLPFLFDRQGRLPCPPCPFTIHVDESGMTSEAFYGAYADQVQYLNGQVLETLDDVISASPDAIVIVFSDHGSRADREQPKEWFRTFFAARVPGRTGVFPDDVRPIETFPRLFGAVFEGEWQIPE